MSEYGFTITDKGQALLTKLLAGEQLTLTRVMVGDGKLSGQNPKTLTDLVSSRHQATTTVPKVQDGAVVFTIQYQNEGETVFPLNEYGVFATDPDEGEILLYYATLGDCPQYVMPGGADIRRFPVSIALSANDVNVVLAFDASAFATPTDIEAINDRLDNFEVGGGVPVKTVTTTIDKSDISATNGTITGSSVVVHKTGNIITVSGWIVISNTASGFSINFSLPYAPTALVDFPCFGSGTPVDGVLIRGQGTVNYQGTVAISGSAKAGSVGLNFNFTYYDGEDFGAGVLEAAGKEVRPVVTPIEFGSPGNATIVNNHLKCIKTGNIVTISGNIEYRITAAGYCTFSAENLPIPMNNTSGMARTGLIDSIGNCSINSGGSFNIRIVHPTISNSSVVANIGLTYQTNEPFALSVVEPDLAPIRTQLNELKEKVEKVSKPDYAGMLKVNVTTDDSGSWENTRVRVTNNLFGQKFYPLDALGQLTLQLLANQTYTVRLVDIPDKYYSQTQMVDIKSQETATLNFTLSTKPDVVGYRIKKATGEVEYIEGAAGMEPARMDFAANKNYPGDWGDHWLFRNIRPCLLKNGEVQYYLNPNDYTKRADGLDADITSGLDGDVMVEFPLVYTKEYEDDTYNTCLMCSENWDGSFHANAFTNQNSVVQETMYMGAYEGYIKNVVTGAMFSRSNNSPNVNQPIGGFRILATNHGPGYQQLEWSKHTLLQNLFVMKYKGLNSQALLGKGNVNSSAALPTGTMNQKGMDWGDQTGTNGVKFCGIEHPWGNLWKFCDGLGVKSNDQIAHRTRAPYNDTLSGYALTGVLKTQPGKTSGHISQMKSGVYGKIPVALDGAENTFYGDYCWFNSSSGEYICYVGGPWGYGSDAGLFVVDLHSVASSSSAGIGARLCYTPQ